MKTEAHGTIAVNTVLPTRYPQPRVLWHVSPRPAPAGYLECRPWSQDPITREYHEGPVALLACSVAGARRLMPAGLEDVDSDGVDGAWFAAPAGARRAA